MSSDHRRARVVVQQGMISYVDRTPGCCRSSFTGMVPPRAILPERGTEYDKEAGISTPKATREYSV